MSLPQNVKCLLEVHRLLAIVVNDGWAVIRRRDYIDLIIEGQPFNSVEILFLDNSDGDSPFRRDFIDLRDKNGDLLCLAWVGSWHQTHPDLSSLVYFKPLTIWRQVSIPLVYTQLVEIVIHIYFFCTLFGMQVSSRREYHWSFFSKKSTNHLVI